MVYFFSFLFASVDAFETFQTSVWIASSFVYVPRESRDIKFESLLFTVNPVLPDAGKFPCFREIFMAIYVRLILPVSTIYITGTFFVK